jgi:YVTN family beta-propeller protein
VARGRLPTAALVAGVLVLLLMSGLGASPRSAATPAPPHGIPSPHAATAPSSPSSWNPESGLSSPGVPAYRLTTVSRAVSSCSRYYGTPAWLAYDSANASFWVASPPSCVEEISANNMSVIATVAVGSSPFGVAVDNATGDVFVTNSGGENVSVISTDGDRVIDSIAVGNSPFGIAYDGATQDLYVANEGTDNVSVISGSTLSVIATIAVGEGPLGIAADPQTGQVFVADSTNNGSNFGQDSVSVIDTATEAVTATLAAGIHPYGVAVDNLTDQVFVTNEGSNNITVVNATTDTAIATIPVPAPSVDLQGIAYDPESRMMWVGGGYSYAVEVNASTLTLAGYFTTDPAGVVFDNDTGDICVTNTANFTFECLSPGWYIYPTDALTFSETGLPTGTQWTVGINVSGLNTTWQSSTSANLTFEVICAPWNLGPYLYSVERSSDWTANPSSGNVSFVNFPSSCSAALVNLSFGLGPPVYAVSFVEYGLPAPTFSVELNGTVEDTTVGVDVFEETNGSYNFTIPESQGRAADPDDGTVVVNGTGVTVDVEFNLASGTYSVTFVESGLPAPVDWSVVFNGTDLASSSTNVTFLAMNGTDYPFAISSVGPYSATPSGGTLNVTGSNLTEFVTFGTVVVQAYALWFNETGLPMDTLWSVTVQGIQPWTGMLTPSTYLSSIEVFLQAGEQGSFNVSEPEDFTASPLEGTFEIPNPGASVVEPIDYTKNSTVGGTPPLPTISSFTATPRSITLGSSVTFAVSVIGGALPLGYSYANLPTGCTIQNVSSLTCTPSETGTWSVTVSVKDTRDYIASAYTIVSVASVPIQIPPPPATTNNSSAPASSTEFLGLPLSEGYEVFAGLLLVGLAVVGYDITRRRGRGLPPSEIKAA